MSSLLQSLRLLGDPNRIRILMLLKQEELSVAELQEILNMGQSSISTHLGQLKKVELVEDRRQGKNSIYRMRTAPDSPNGNILRLSALLEEAASEVPEVDTDRRALDLVLARRQDRMRAYFNSLAGRFGREYVPGRSWQGMAEMLLKLMPPLVIADLGAGEAALSQLLAQRAERVIAVDSSENMVAFGRDLATRHGLVNLDYRLGDLEALPIPTDSVDLAIFSQSLHHATHPLKALREAGRIIKPGGRTAVLDLRKHSFEQARELYADLWLGFSESELVALLKQAGFDPVDVAVVHKEPEAPHFETVLAIGQKPASLPVS
jgi:ubiquinone/menaquinone biosynthesis C-methylase UbiE/DNA-binding transcriptional ArsR family regulator